MPDYSPEKLNVAAGTSSDPFNLGLSDKAAKEFAKATDSIEKSGKMGTWSTISGLVMSLVQSSPALEIVGAFLEKWSAAFSGAIDWQQLITIFESLTPVVSAAMLAIGAGLNPVITSLGDESEDSEKDVKGLTGAIEKCGEAVGWFTEKVMALLRALPESGATRGEAGEDPDELYAGPGQTGDPADWWQGPLQRDWW